MKTRPKPSLGKPPQYRHNLQPQRGVRNKVLRLRDCPFRRGYPGITRGLSFQPQGGCDTKPRVGPSAGLPWANAAMISTPKGLWYRAQGSPVCGDTLGNRRIKISTPPGLRKTGIPPTRRETRPYGGLYRIPGSCLSCDFPLLSSPLSLHTSGNTFPCRR